VARPVYLSIPVIGVHTRLIRLGLTAQGTLQVPASTSVAGWYTGSPRPGQVGSAVIAGHIDSYLGPGVFFRLRLLRTGDRVYIRHAGGTLAVFRVYAERMYAKDRFPTQQVYGPAPDPELRFIACGGTFDAAIGSYLSNVVVLPPRSADQARAQTTGAGRPVAGLAPWRYQPRKISPVRASMLSNDPMGGTRFSQ
jgi:Sortase domain